VKKGDEIRDGALVLLKKLCCLGTMAQRGDGDLAFSSDNGLDLP
jgi:hypothetical protein